MFLEQQMMLKIQLWQHKQILQYIQIENSNNTLFLNLNTYLL